MCIITDKIKIAEDNIPVYKVFYNKNGVLQFPFKRWEYPIFNPHKKAVGFDKGYGYSCFLSLELAERYQSILKKDPYIVDNIIISLFIPKGTRYAIGSISRGYYGQGLDAVRTEELSY